MSDAAKDGLAARPGSATVPELGGISAPTLAQQVAYLEYRCHELNHMLGEVIATCLTNLESGAIKCTDPLFLQYLEARSTLRVQLEGDYVAMSPNAPASSTKIDHDHQTNSKSAN